MFDVLLQHLDGGTAHGTGKVRRRPEVAFLSDPVGFDVRIAFAQLDAGWHLLKTQLKYKAIARSGVFEEVNEAYSTQVCSCCRVKPDSSPKGRTALGIRHWICSECGAEHDRDINAALNILAAGGIPVSMEESSPFRASEDVKSTQRERNRQTMTNLILNKELLDLRHNLNLLNIDFWWLLGLNQPVTHAIKKNSNDPVNPPQRALLIRFLIKHPELSPLPEPPGVKEMYRMVSAHWRDVIKTLFKGSARAMLHNSPMKKRLIDGEALNMGSFGLLFGVNAGQGIKWGHGTTPVSSITGPLFIMVRNLIQEHGKEGLEVYLEILDTLAKEHGYPNGFAEVLFRRRWPPSDTVPMTNRDLYDMRENMGYTNQVMSWLFHASAVQLMNMNKLTPEKPVTSRTRVIIANLVRRNPHLMPLPSAPPISEIVPVIFGALSTTVMPAITKLDIPPAELFGVLCGVSRQQGKQWFVGARHTATCDRLITFIHNAIQRYGVIEGVQMYWDILNDEANARGFGDFMGLLKTPRCSWAHGGVGVNARMAKEAKARKAADSSVGADKKKRTWPDHRCFAQAVRLRNALPAHCLPTHQPPH